MFKNQDDKQEAVTTVENGSFNSMISLKPFYSLISTYFFSLKISISVSFSLGDSVYTAF